MYRPLPLDALALNQPVPVNIWDAQGVLLLRKGETIHSEQHRGHLMLHTPMVLAADWQALNWGYTATLDRLVRDNAPLARIAGVRELAVAAATPDTAELPDVPPAERWADLHAALHAWLHRPVEAASPERLDRLERIADAVTDASERAFDTALLVLVQRLFDPVLPYSASHALLCGLLCDHVGRAAKLPPAELHAVVRAALTMNMGMARLHDELARQSAPPTTAQRAQIREHPVRSVSLLRGLGVREDRWLDLVATHHEHRDGIGYPRGERVDSPALRLLRMADVYTACISPREGRGGLQSQQVARELYTGAATDPLTPLFIKAVGLYPPGSYVRLAGGERGVVVRRGAKANAPKVLVLVGRQGLPLGEPALRDTADAPWAVVAALAPGEVKVRPPLEYLLARR